MDPPLSDRVRGYRTAILNTAWSVAGVGIVLLAIGLLLGLFAGLFLGVWVTIVGAMLVVLASVWFWTSEAVPDRVLAGKLAPRGGRPDTPPEPSEPVAATPPDSNPPA